MKIALVGNQNSGKTTMFNLLTGSNQKIGNWPGVTVEKKEGIIKGTHHTLIDLPGIYSLSPYTNEEEIARKFLLEEKPDLIINIVDTTSIERSLYLTTQLMELDIDVVLVLNMIDMLDKKGITVDYKQLSSLLNLEVFLVSALKKTGSKKIIDFLITYKHKDKIEEKIFDTVIEHKIEKIYCEICSPNKRFITIKTLEGDKDFKEYQSEAISLAVKDIEKVYEDDIEGVIANGRYEYIEKIKNKCFVQKTQGISITDRLDKVFLNKWLAIPIFLIIMMSIYVLSVGVIGGASVGFVSDSFTNFGDYLSNKMELAGASSWATSLIADGMIAGVGAVLGFVPQLVILFLCISLLETTGYMARIAFFLDRVFHKFGLSGKTLIPFIVGTGCSVPGIMTTRTIENHSEREMAIVLTPFIPCSAKLPIIGLFAGAIFGNQSGLIAFSLYFMAIIVIIISALILKKIVYKGDHGVFISELPEYKKPSVSYVIRDVYEKSFEFIKKAGTIILLASIITWFLVSFSWRFQYGVGIENSILASIGNVFAWIFYPILGEWSWAATVSAFQGLVAKENVVSTMMVINGIGEGSNGESIVTGGNGIFGFFTAPSAYAFMTFNLFSAPCFGAIAAMKRELGSKTKLFKAVGFQTLIAWIMATAIYQIGSLVVNII